MFYKSCEYIEKGINFNTDNQICFCCHCSNVGGGYGSYPYLQNIKTGQTVDWDDYFTEKLKIRKQNSSGSIDKICEGCVALREENWPDNNEVFSYFNFHYFTKCDSNCIYCYTARDKRYFNTCENYRIYPFLKDLKRKNLIAPNGYISFGGGEVALLDEFNDIIKFFEPYNYSIKVCTSGIHYSKTIEKALKKGNMEILISVDSGTKETFAKVKGTKHFDRVWDNIKKYAKVQKLPVLVKSKFIVVPELNDSENEIKLWIEKSKDAGVNIVVIEIESNYYQANRESIPESLINLFHFAHKTAKDLGLDFLLYDRSSHMMSEHNWDFWKDYSFLNDPTMPMIEEHLKKQPVKKGFWK